MGLRRIPGKKVWIFQMEINGKTWSRSTGQTNKKLALREIPRLRKLAETCRARLQSTPQNLSQAIKTEVGRVRKDVSASQGIRVEFALCNFTRWAGDIKLELITPAMLEDYQRQRLANVSISTTNRELIYILRMLRNNGISLPKPSPKPGKVTGQRAFTRDEIVKLFDVCPAHLKPLYLLMLATGARHAEFVPSTRSTHTPLLKSEVDLEQRIIRLRPAKQRQGTQKRDPKVRIIPLPAWAIEPLREQMRSTPGQFVFQPLVNPARQFDRILKAAVIPKVDALGNKLTAHSFRHTYATLLAELLGHNAFVLKEALGHACLSMTERYCHPTAPNLEIALPELTGDKQNGTKELQNNKGT